MTIIPKKISTTAVSDDHPAEGHPALLALVDEIQVWARELGFQAVGISDVELGEHRDHLQHWLDQRYHGEMQWMQTHQEKRNFPAQLVPNTIRVISARMNYLPENTQYIQVLKQTHKAYISRYALGRDYHKLIRKRLSVIAKKVEARYTELAQQYHWPIDTISQRPFVDSAPVLEKALAEKAGLGWIGKNTLVLNKEAGSWFFLGEVLTNIPLPINQAVAENKCGDCSACLKVCPTDAFVGPYKLDATRCISYLTIELKGSIPEEFREPIGNRVFGCDDCQAICPWNKYAKHSNETDFSPRHALEDSELATLFLWTEAEYLQRTEGSAIRRIGYERWLRNLAIGLGNAPKSPAIVAALEERQQHPSVMVQEHIQWALKRQLSDKKSRRKIKKPARESHNE
ncbi:MAG: epoxyqueuosine reductase [Kiritimatiellia bacterium]|jgi:epoxyqueuosine reductase